MAETVLCKARHECFSRLNKKFKEEAKMDLIKALTNEQLKENVPVINVGDTVRVYNKIKEGNR